jgi:hypothetical protein
LHKNEQKSQAEKHFLSQFIQHYFKAENLDSSTVLQVFDENVQLVTVTDNKNKTVRKYIVEEDLRGN